MTSGTPLHSFVQHGVIRRASRRIGSISILSPRAGGPAAKPRESGSAGKAQPATVARPGHASRPPRGGEIDGRGAGRA